MHLTLHIYPKGQSCSFAIVYKHDRYSREYTDSFAESYMTELK